MADVKIKIEGDITSGATLTVENADQLSKIFKLDVLTDQISKAFDKFKDSIDTFNKASNAIVNNSKKPVSSTPNTTTPPPPPASVSQTTNSSSSNLQASNATLSKAVTSAATMIQSSNAALINALNATTRAVSGSTTSRRSPSRTSTNVFAHSPMPTSYATAAASAAIIPASTVGLWKNLLTANSAMGGSLNWVTKLGSSLSGISSAFNKLGKGAVITAIFTELVGMAFKGLIAIIGSIITAISGMIASSIKMTMQFLDGENKLSSFVHGLAEFTSNIPIIGGVLGGLIGIVGSVIKHLEDLSDTQANLSSSGASFNQNLLLLKRTANQTGSTLEQFSSIVKGNTENFASFGTVTTGALKFAAASKTLREEFRNMGYTTEAFNDELASTMGLLGTGAALRGENDTKTTFAAKGLMIEFDLLAKITGKSRKSQEEKLKAEMLELAWQRKLATLEDEERKKLLAAYAAAAMSGQGAADVFKAGAAGLGIAATEAGRMFTVAAPAAARDILNFSKNVQKAGESEQESVARMDDFRSSTLEKTINAANKFEGAIKATASGVTGTALLVATVFKDATLSGKGYIDKNNLFNKLAFDEATKKARAEQKSREGVVSSLKHFEEMVMNLRDSVITKILVPMLEKFTPMLEKFVNWIANNQDFLIKKIQDFGVYIIKVASDIGGAIMSISTDDIQTRMIEMLSYVGEVVVLNILKMLGLMSEATYNQKLEAINLQKSLNDTARQTQKAQIDKIKSEQELSSLTKQQQLAQTDGIRLANEKLKADKSVIDAKENINKIDQNDVEGRKAAEAVLKAAELSQKTSDEAFDKVKQFVTFDKNTKTGELTAKLDTKAFEDSIKETSRLTLHIQQLNETLKQKGPIDKKIEQYRDEKEWAFQQRSRLEGTTGDDFKNKVAQLRRETGTKFDGIKDIDIQQKLTSEINYKQKQIEDLQSRSGSNTDSKEKEKFNAVKDRLDEIRTLIPKKEGSIKQINDKTFLDWRLEDAKNASKTEDYFNKEKQSLLDKEKLSIKLLREELTQVTKSFETLRSNLKLPEGEGAIANTTGINAMQSLGSPSQINTGNSHKDIFERFKQFSQRIGQNNSLKSTESVAGGTAEDNLLRIAEKMPKNLGQFTAFNDTLHQGVDYKNSKHNKGKAFDFVVNQDKNVAEFISFKEANPRATWIDFLKSDQGDKWIEQKIRGAAGNIPVKILNEYARPSKGSTGGHMHVELERETGSIGKTSRLFENFGSGTPLTAHGLESIVTPDQMKFLFTDVQTRTAKNFTTILTDLLKPQNTKDEVKPKVEIPEYIQQKPAEDKSATKIIEAFNNGISELSGILDDIKTAVESSNKNLGKVVRNTV